MSYSSIQDKYGICKDCNDGIEKPLIAGRCKYVHYKSYRASLMLAKQKEKNKLRSLIQSPKNKILLEEKGIIKGEGLELWFKVKMNLNEPRCMECGAYKPELKQWPKGWKSCQAHILPKRHFKSISTHPLAGLVLGSGLSGLCHCHDFYDSAWSKAETMKIWPEVCRRFLILYPLIKPEEHQFIPEVLLKTLK